MRKNGGLTCEARVFSPRDILCELGEAEVGVRFPLQPLTKLKCEFVLIENRIKHKLSMKKQIERTKTNLDFERD